MSNWKIPTAQTCPHGDAIYLVDGEHVRDHFDSDFVQGGNASRYKWIPGREIWLDASMPPEEMKFVLHHECEEAAKMRHGEGYDAAHDEAKRDEDRSRHDSPEEMAKNQTTPVFPGLGLPDDRRETPIVAGVLGWRTKRLGMATNAIRANQGSQSPQDVKLTRDTAKAGKYLRYASGATSGVPGTHAAFAVSNKLKQRTGQNPSPAPQADRDEKTDQATQLHENFHQMMLRVQEKYGPQARHNVAKYLAEGALPLPIAGAVHALARTMHPKGDSHEERIAVLHNYLNSPGYRAEFHSRRNHSEPERQAYNETLKQAHRLMREKSADLTPEHLAGLEDARRNSDDYNPWEDTSDPNSLIAKTDDDSVKPVNPKPPKPRRVQKPKPAPLDTKNLVVMHNLTEENLHHAAGLGGLAAPSLAVSHKDHPLTGFGEISLVAHPDLIDPRHTPVYDADVYSPRFPTTRYKTFPKEVDKFKKWLAPYVDKVGSDRHTTLYSVGEDAEKNGHKGAIGRHLRPAAQLAFLEEKGQHVEPVMRQKEPSYPWAEEPAFREFAAKGLPEEQENFRPGDETHRAMSEAAVAGMKSHAKDLTDVLNEGDSPEEQQEAYNERLKSMLDRHIDPETGLLNFYHADRARREASKVGSTEVDQYATEEKLKNAIEPHKEEFANWLNAKTKPMEGRPYIIRNSGSKAAYSLDNIMKEMTRKVRAGEDFNYGLGTARSLGATRFGDLTHMASSRWRIVPREEFQKLKDANDAKFVDLATKLAAHHPAYKEGRGAFGQMDALSRAVGESYKRGRSIASELRRDGYVNVPSALVHELQEFATNLKNMPTEYFEAKPQRAVGINEFKAAVVPHDVRPETLELLKRHGIGHIETYRRGGNDEAAQRTAALQRAAGANDLMLSERDVVSIRKTESHPVDCAAVLVSDGIGRILLGKRRDNGRWTMPAGHLNPGEDPEVGARRELQEEAALTPEHLTYLKTAPLPDGAQIHCYTAYMPGTALPHGRNDPDQEVEKWQWIDARDGIPQNVWSKLHGPPGDQNLLRQIFDLKKSERIWLDAGFADLQKSLSSIPRGPEVQKDLYDYSHLLQPQHRREGYRLFVSTAGPHHAHLGAAQDWSYHPAEAIVTHGHTQVGQVRGGISQGNLHIGRALVTDAHRGRGFGTAGYEALMAHAHHAGVQSVSGDVHTPGARAIHQKLAVKHGLGYNAAAAGPGKFGEYGYMLKSAATSEGLTKGYLQREVPYNPANRPAGETQIWNWVDTGGGRDSRQAVPEMPAGSPERVRALHKLSGQTSVRRAADGKREFLLHRGVGRNEHRITTKTKTSVQNSDLSSWTPDHSVALKFAQQYEPKRSKVAAPPIVQSAWIHEDKIHNVPYQYGHLDLMLGPHNKFQVNPETGQEELVPVGADQWKPGHMRLRDEKEVIVKPHASPLATPEETNGVLDPLSNIDNRISQPSNTVKGRLSVLRTYRKSEAEDLLKHPDPRERSLALKLDSVSSEDLARALLDPHPAVWQTAFRHPEAPLEILASHTRDASGAPLFDRHDALLADPRCRQHHAEAMRRGLEADSYLPIDIQAQRLALSNRPDLKKSAWAQEMIRRGTAEPIHQEADHRLETRPASAEPLVSSYHQHVPQGHGQEFVDDDPGCQLKSVYRTPSGHTFMVKPYHDADLPLSGWAEGTSQALYHAAGIGDLHQTSFVAPHGAGKNEVPATVIHIESAKPVGRVAHNYFTPEAKEQARKIGLMDYVTGNIDRHSYNLMMKPSGSLMAIDHGMAFQYRNGQRPSNHLYYTAIDRVSGPFDDGSDEAHRYAPALQWWKSAAPQVRKTFQDRLAAIKNPKQRQLLAKNFEARAAHLDRLAAQGESLAPGWFDQKPEEGQQ